MPRPVRGAESRRWPHLPRRRRLVRDGTGRGALQFQRPHGRDGLRGPSFMIGVHPPAPCSLRIREVPQQIMCSGVSGSIVIGETDHDARN